MNIEKVKISEVKPNKDNPRTISKDKRKKLVQSIKEFPDMLKIRPIVVDSDMVVLGGNMRLQACKDAKLKEIYIIKADELTEAQKREFIVKDNVGFGEWDWDVLANEWDIDELEGWGLDVLTTEEKEEKAIEEAHGKLVETFLMPPFSILDTRQGYWMERKRLWRTLIQDNGETREGVLSGEGMIDKYNNGTSILDPVLSEILIKWFCIDKGNIIDPFAGDTVMGYISGYRGYQFTGIEIRKEQADVNNARVKEFGGKYINDDGQNILKHVKEGTQDMMFSCPPYFDLEVYSDLENDASNQDTYEEFIQIIRNALTDGLKTLKENRFATIVVGDIRKNDGFYRRFVDDINTIMVQGGAQLYNELILVEPLGTLPQRVNRYMGWRKVGKCHQNVLVFYKGDPSTIKQIYPKLEYIDDFDVNIL
jgi:16S rRNA G966 N2-methylase RsmD